MADMDGMSVVVLPTMPAVVTQADLDALQELREQHEKELRAYEEETRRRRRQRHKQRKLAERQTAENGTEQSLIEDVNSTQAREKEQEEAKRIAEEEAARIEAERLEDEEFRAEEAKLLEELQQLRLQRKQREEALSRGSFAKRPSEVESVASEFLTAEDGRSRAPSSAPSVTVSAAPSVASSAAPSRSNSPTGSDTGGRTLTLPINSLSTVAVVGGKGKGKGSGKSLPLAVVADPSPSNSDTPTARGNENAPPSGPPPGATGINTPRKGSGKGKNILPPPSGGLSTPRNSLQQGQLSARPTNKYVNLYWKVSQKPEAVDEQTFANDPFLSRLRDPDQEVRSHPALVEAFPKINVPDLPAKIFDPSLAVKVEEIPEPMLERYFKRNESAVKLPNGDNNQTNQGAKSIKILDQKRLHMVGVMLQKHYMEHKEETSREAVLNIKRGVLRCDRDMVKLEDLSVIRTVLRQHVKEGSPLCDYVKTNGVDAIWFLECPEHHYLVYELTKVPQVDERLDCMLFQLEFRDNMKKYQENLKTLMKALDALRAKRDLIRRFFVTAHRLGQSLSQKPSRGFQLSTLEKLTQTKSTKLPHLSILHFVLALMSREDAEELFSDADIALLRNAKALSTAKVCDDCRELAQGLYGVKSIYESGEYTSQSGQAVRIERRRLTLPPEAAAAAAESRMEPGIDTDDRFHEVMKNFVDSHVDEADDIVVECHRMLLTYKELALFFDDLSNVYPPPKELNDPKGKLDLVDVFYRFAKVVPQHRQQVEDEGLREKLRQS